MALKQILCSLQPQSPLTWEYWGVFYKGSLKTTTLHFVAGHLFGNVSCERITFSVFAVILLEGLGFPLMNLCG